MNSKSLQSWIQDWLGNYGSSIALCRFKVGDVVRIKDLFSTMSLSYIHRLVGGKLAVITGIMPSKSVWYQLNVLDNWPCLKGAFKIQLPHQDVTLSACHTLVAAAYRERQNEY